MRLSATTALLLAFTFLTVTAFMQGKSQRLIPAADQPAASIADQLRKEASVQPEKEGMNQRPRKKPKK